MESSTQSRVLRFTHFDRIPELKVPSMCEIWNWEGDTTVLPFKFADVLNQTAFPNAIGFIDDDEEDEFFSQSFKEQKKQQQNLGAPKKYNHKELKQQYIDT